MTASIENNFDLHFSVILLIQTGSRLVRRGSYICHQVWPNSSICPIASFDSRFANICVLREILRYLGIIIPNDNCIYIYILKFFKCFERDENFISLAVKSAYVVVRQDEWQVYYTRGMFKYSYSLMFRASAVWCRNKSAASEEVKRVGYTDKKRAS